MIEIVAASVVMSILVGGILILIQLWIIHRQFYSQAHKNLNINLAKVGLYWSASRGDFETLSPTNNPDLDRQKLIRSTLMLSLLGFLNVLGVLFLFAVIFSINTIMKSRRELEVFDSELTQRNDLSSNEVSQLVATLGGPLN